VLAFVFFVVGSFAGALLAHSGVHDAAADFWSGRSLAGPDHRLHATWISSGWIPIAVVSSAMGAMNTALSRVGAQYVIRTFVTETLSRIGLQLAPAVRRAPLPDSQGSRDTHLYRPLVSKGIWAGVPDRRIVGDSDTALWSVGIASSHTDPVGADGV
jgi:uncharacterized membrane protein YoaK (UPF0700 family)